VLAHGAGSPRPASTTRGRRTLVKCGKPYLSLAVDVAAQPDRLMGRLPAPAPQSGCEDGEWLAAARGVRTWRDQDGADQSRLEVVAEEVVLIGLRCAAMNPTWLCRLG
jgi:hypothetical protein